MVEELRNTMSSMAIPYIVTNELKKLKEQEDEPLHHVVSRLIDMVYND